LALAAAAVITAAVAIHPPPDLVRLPLSIPVEVGTVPTGAPAQAPPARPAKPVTPRASTAALIPTRVRIPRLNVDSTVIPVVVDRAGALGVPRDPHVVGWWADGAKPGAATGTAILDGHVNYAGVTGSLARLDLLRPGDVVILDGLAGGRHPVRQRFVVTGTRTYDKHTLPAGEVFNQGGIGRLVLVTCGGAFDQSSGNYTDNILTYALPEGGQT
jgi:hypothetical protein